MTEATQQQHGLNIGVLLPNSYVEILPPNGTILGDGVMGRRLGHEDGALVNSISALMKETPKNSLAPFLPCGDTKYRASMLSRSVVVPIFETQWIVIPPDCSQPGSPVHGIFQASKISRPFPPPGDLPKPGIKPTSPLFPVLTAGIFTTEPPGKSA